MMWKLSGTSEEDPAAFLVYLLIQPPCFCIDQVGQIVETELWLMQKSGQQLATAAMHEALHQACIQLCDEIEWVRADSYLDLIRLTLPSYDAQV